MGEKRGSNHFYGTNRLVSKLNQQRNDGGRVFGIVKAALVVSAFLMATASIGAAQITVDGNAGDWVGLSGVKCVTDATGEIGSLQQPYFVNGFDIEDFCVFYDPLSDTLYFKINVTGVPGDTDGNLDNSNSSDISITDDLKVGVGDSYRAYLDVDGDSIQDYFLQYTNNVVKLLNVSDPFTPLSGTAAGSIGANFNIDSVIEMSYRPAHNVTDFKEWSNFTAWGWAGSSQEGLGEDITSHTTQSAGQPVYSPKPEQTTPLEQGEERQTPGFEAAYAFFVVLAVVPFLRKTIR